MPGIGHLPVNAYVLHADQPVVVDTGLSTPYKDFVTELSKVIDPADVRWIWITHPDRDHTGGLWELLEAAPQARLVTTFIGVGIMSTQWEVPTTGSDVWFGTSHGAKLTTEPQRSGLSHIAGSVDASAIGCATRVVLSSPSSPGRAAETKGEQLRDRTRSGDLCRALARE